ncbi:MAG: type IV pilin protein [Blautia sp.]
MNENDGFTLAELLIVVAIIGVLVAISIPIFSSQLEKSGEATDLANVRSAYAKIMAEAIDTEIPEPIKVDLVQKKLGWQTSSTLTVGGISNNDKDNWLGTRRRRIFVWFPYEKDKGAILNWRRLFWND